MTDTSLLVNRAPVLTLWASIVAERLGHPHATALTLGKAVAGLNAQSKGRRLGIYEEPAKSRATRPAGRKAIEKASVELLGRAVPVVSTPDGLRAVVKDRPERPESVERYLEQKFGAGLPAAREAMGALAKAYGRGELAAIAYELYEQFRPRIPEGVRGWGAKGPLDLGAIRAMATGSRRK
jgi:hypothetical protein